MVCFSSYSSHGDKVRLESRWTTDIMGDDGVGETTDGVACMRSEANKDVDIRVRVKDDG